MSPRAYIHYRRDLKSKSRALRRDPTPAERKRWFDFLSTHPLKFTRQKPLGRYIADFYCAQALLVIEVDGDSHFTGSAEGYDRARSDALERNGVRVVRFSNAEVMEQFEGVCRAIDEALSM